MAELTALTDRWAKQREADLYRAAFVAAAIINVHRNPKKRPISPAELLGHKSAQEQMSASADEIRAVFTALARQRR